MRTLNRFVTEKSNVKIEDTKTKTGKSEINLKTCQFYILNSILYQFLNFDFRFSNLIFIFKFIYCRLHTTDFCIPDFNPMKTSVKGTV